MSRKGIVLMGMALESQTDNGKGMGESLGTAGLGEE